MKLNKMIDDLEGWPAHEMWMGVVPKKLTALLEDIGVSKKEVPPTWLKAFLKACVFLLSMIVYLVCKPCGAVAVC